MKPKQGTPILIFSILLLVVGIVVGIIASKYLHIFNSTTPEAVCQRGGYQSIRACGGYFIAERPCCDQGADIWNGKNQIVVSCGGFSLPPGAPESECEKLLKNLDTKNCQELVCSPEDAKRSAPTPTTDSGENGFRNGILEATVIRSPTCAGPGTDGKSCESPYANETFKIIRVSDNKVMQTVTTDRNGVFTFPLPSGDYLLQNTQTGIGKRVNNSSFTIFPGKTTTQRFDVDTGIR